jgi:hypothetical protein
VGAREPFEGARRTALRIVGGLHPRAGHHDLAILLPGKEASGENRQPSRRSQGMATSRQRSEPLLGDQDAELAPEMLQRREDHRVGDFLAADFEQEQRRGAVAHRAPPAGAGSSGNPASERAER